MRYIAYNDRTFYKPAATASSSKTLYFRRKHFERSLTTAANISTNSMAGSSSSSRAMPAFLASLQVLRSASMHLCVEAPALRHLSGKIYARGNLRLFPPREGCSGGFTPPKYDGPVRNDACVSSLTHTHKVEITGTGVTQTRKQSVKSSRSCILSDVGFRWNSLPYAHYAHFAERMHA